MPTHFAWASVACLVMVAAAPAQEQDPKIKRAIVGGRQFLQAAYRPGGNMQQLPPGVQPNMIMEMALGGDVHSGAAALAGLAMIEAGCRADDPSVANIAAAVRQNAFSNPGTYPISLMIMFLDRLGLPGDKPIIQFLAIRLLSGQAADGTWSYASNGISLDPVQQQQLIGVLARDSTLRTPGTTPRPGPGSTAPKKPESRPRDDLDGEKPRKPPARKEPKERDEERPAPRDEKPRDGLHPALGNLLKQVQEGNFARAATGDHSNTQFATVALWIARRHGVPVDEALKKIDQHYRLQQNKADGGWGYTTSGGASSGAMTCAGLMGLAVGFGAKNLDARGGGAKVSAAEEFDKDPAVQAGLKFLGAVLEAGPPHKHTSSSPLFPEGGINFYFLWSLERVGMVYGLKTIGKVDWYQWAIPDLLEAQNRRNDGGWTGTDFHSGSDKVATSFALLFLCRANLTEDITNSLRGKVRDPGQSSLRSGGDIRKFTGQSPSTSGSGGTRRPDEGVAKPKARPTEPPVDEGSEQVRRLVNDLIRAKGLERSELIKTYEATKGSEYTEALARSAARLSGSEQAAVRQALAQRMTRLTPASLVHYMEAAQREFRAAAARAAGTKDKAKLPEMAAVLIRLIGDDEFVSQSARSSLKILTGQDFGPNESSASAAERTRARAAWQKWWDSQAR